uniref:DNA (cytosine-5-)-methyltransferase n=1 Tax=viral metagenome TaxID=1070528 RepID=A0A6C0CXW5_9ZZZZ
MKCISLFSGMGGDSYGIIKSGCELVAYSELEKVFRETHDLNFNSELLGNGDITKTDDDTFYKYNGIVNLIFAGFPCQGFSNAGKKLPDDPRNTLFREFLRATKLINPDYIIGENVKGLMKRLTSDGNKYIDIIEREFNDLGYDISYEVLKCHEYGIPQSRERLIIVGVKKSLNKKFEFPNKINEKPNLKDIVKFSMEGAIKINPEDYDMSTIPSECIIKDLENDEDEDLNDKNKKPHPNLVVLAKKRDYVYKGVEYPNRLSFGKRIPVGGEIIDIRKPSKTIICTYARQPRLFVPLQNKNGYYLRCLLPDELKQIQGFPKDFKLSGNKTKQIVQIGNAVPPPLIQQIVQNLISM